MGSASSRQRRVVLAAVAAALAVVAAGGQAAAEGSVELAYDDGVGGATLRGLAPGDVEVVRMTPEHPARLVAVRLAFATAGCTAHVAVWADNGGNAPDLDRVLWETDAAVEATGWLELALPEGAVTIDPPREIYVGHVLQDPPCQLSWAVSGSTEARSLARMGGSVYSITDGGDPPGYLDALVRARVVYFDVRSRFDFEEVTEEAGLAGGMRRMAWGDYDDDGDDDLLVSGAELYRNEGDGGFVDVSDDAGISGTGANGGLWADYDDDGRLDFFASVSSYHPACESDDDCVWCTIQDNPDGTSSCVEEQHDHSCVAGLCTPPSGEVRHDLLWHNEGDGTFREVSEEAGGPYDFMPTEAAAWGDYDRDGSVDLYVANYETPITWVRGVRGVGTPDFLWHNEGDGTFRDASRESGIRDLAPMSGRGVAWADYDGDGDLDLYVANYRLQPNLFFDNDGDGTFGLISRDNGTAGVPISGAYGHSIGADWADYDRDGDWDLFVANLAHPRFLDFSDMSMLYQNGGAPYFPFSDVREAAGITYSETHSNPAWGDIDNDGLEDLFITDVYVGYRSFLYRAAGDGTFVDATYPSGIDVDDGWGCAWADYDGDGRLDLAATGLYLNQIEDAGHWLEVHLRGVESNAAAIGAVVTVRTAGPSGGSQMRQVEGGSGTGVQSSLTLHFGLGEATEAESVEVRWPSGLTQTRRAVAADQRLDWREGDEPPVEDGGPDAGPDGGGDGGPAPLAARGGGCACRAGQGEGLEGLLASPLVAASIGPVRAFGARR